MANKTNWISLVVDDETIKLIEREYARRIKTRKTSQRISKSDVVRDALAAYFMKDASK